MNDERTKKIMQGFMEGATLSAKKIKEFQPNNYDCYRIWRMVLDHAREYETIGNEVKKRETIIYDTLEQAKTFNINEKVKYLLQPELTKKSFLHKDYKLPFNAIFIDTSLTVENSKIFGMLITVMNESNKNLWEGLGLDMVDIKEGVLINTTYFSEKQNTFGRVLSVLDLTNGRKALQSGQLKQAMDEEQFLVDDYVSSFVFNLLHFLNEPRVTIYVQDRNGKARAKRGLIPLPSELKTKIHIDLENYIEKIYFTGLSHSKLGFSFWVRGHWRLFRSPIYVNKQGQKTWILPHIRGEGLIPPQIFEVT